MNRSTEQRIAESTQAANNPHYPYESKEELNKACDSLEEELDATACSEMSKLFPKKELEQ